MNNLRDLEQRMAISLNDSQALIYYAERDLGTAHDVTLAVKQAHETLTAIDQDLKDIISTNNLARANRLRKAG